MKCDNCPALRTEGYEYPEEYCCVYGEDECLEFKDGSYGCRHRLATIEKRLEQLREIEDHQWDGIGEWYEQDQKIDNAVREAVKEACRLADIVFASEGSDGSLWKYRMDDEIPSALTEFAWRFRAAIEEQGYDIVKREGKSNENNQT